MPRITILIAEDHPIVREGLAALLQYQSEFEVVGLATDGQDAVQKHVALEPQVTLMDLQMPVKSGTDAIAEIIKQNQTAKILVLTTYEGDDDVRRALAAGARGYLLKDAGPEELFRAIRAVSQGDTYLCRSAKDATQALPPATLSEREVEVLKLVARGLTNRQTAQELFLSEATVRTHVGHIFAKLDVSDRVAAVMIATSRGILRG